jgi:hypothetical protein
MIRILRLEPEKFRYPQHTHLQVFLTEKLIRNERLFTPNCYHRNGCDLSGGTQQSGDV